MKEILTDQEIADVKNSDYLISGKHSLERAIEQAIISKQASMLPGDKVEAVTNILGSDKYGKSGWSKLYKTPNSSLVEDIRKIACEICSLFPVLDRETVEREVKSICLVCRENDCLKRSKNESCSIIKHITDAIMKLQKP